MSDDPAPGIPLDPNTPPPPPPVKKKGQRHEDDQENGSADEHEEPSTGTEAPTSETNE